MIEIILLCFDVCEGTSNPQINFTTVKDGTNFSSLHPAVHLHHSIALAEFISLYIWVSYDSLEIMQGFVYLSKALLGFDAFCLNKKFLVYNLIDRNLKVKYRRSFFGFLWTIIGPLATAAIYFFVFKVVLKVDRQNYLPFLISGVIPWSFFAQSINESTESIVGNSGLISKIPVPIHVFPYVVTLTNFSTLLFATPIIILITIASGVPISLGMLWIFYFLLCLLIVSYALGTILAIFFVYLRDLKHAIGLILQIWFYATPIIYDESMIPEEYRFILFANPVGAIFSGIHGSVVSTPHTNMIILAICSAAWCLITLIGLRLVYAKFRKGLVEVL